MSQFPGPFQPLLSDGLTTSPTLPPGLCLLLLLSCPYFLSTFIHFSSSCTSNHLLDYPPFPHVLLLITFFSSCCHQSPAPSPSFSSRQCSSSGFSSLPQLHTLSPLPRPLAASSHSRRYLPSLPLTQGYPFLPLPSLPSNPTLSLHLSSLPIFPPAALTFIVYATHSQTSPHPCFSTCPQLPSTRSSFPLSLTRSPFPSLSPHRFLLASFLLTPAPPRFASSLRLPASCHHGFPLRWAGRRLVMTQFLLTPTLEEG